MDGEAASGGARDARSVSALRAMFEAGGRRETEDAGERRERPPPRPDAPAPPAPRLLARREAAAAPGAAEQGAARGRAPSAAHGDAGASGEPSAEWPLLNNEGNAVALGRHPDFKSLYYCGQERPIPGSDGFCGIASCSSLAMCCCAPRLRGPRPLRALVSLPPPRSRPAPHGDPVRPMQVQTTARSATPASSCSRRCRQCMPRCGRQTQQGEGGARCRRLQTTPLRARCPRTSRSPALLRPGAMETWTVFQS